MSCELIANLADCSKFRQTLMARPPRVVHCTVILLAGLIVTALIWASVVQANLVVRATGRVRAAEVPTRVFAPNFADLTGRVVEAPFDEGDFVHAGDVLVRLDAAQIDNRIAKLTRTLEATEEELEKLTGMETLLSDQLAAAKDKATAELAQAEATLKRATEERLSQIRAVRAAVTAARDVAERKQRLRSSGAVTEEEVVKAIAALRETEEKLVAANLELDSGAVRVARKALELVDRDYAVRRAEAEARRAAKQGEAAAVRRDLRQLQLQRAESVLRSAIDGVVVTGRINAGDVLEPGKPVMEIARRDGYCFEAAVASEDVGHLRVGMAVRIKFDAYDYQRYGVMTGIVTYISPDSQLPREGGADSNAGARNAPPAYLVRVEMSSDEFGRGEFRGDVKLGLGGVAEIVTKREALLKIFFQKIRQSISLG